MEAAKNCSKSKLVCIFTSISYISTLRTLHVHESVLTIFIKLFSYSVNSAQIEDLRFKLLFLLIYSNILNLCIPDISQYIIIICRRDDNMKDMTP